MCPSSFSFKLIWPPAMWKGCFHRINWQILPRFVLFHKVLFFFFLQNLSSLNSFYTKLPLLVCSEEKLGLKDEHRVSVQKILTRWTISDGVCCWEKFCHTSSVEVELLPQEHLSKICAKCTSKPLQKFLTAWNPSDRERTQIHLHNVQELMKMQNYVSWSIITIFVDQSFSNN